MCWSGLYPPPPEGTVYSSVDLFDDVENILVDIQSRHDCYILLAGDFNAYTKNLKDFIDPSQTDDVGPVRDFTAAFGEQLYSVKCKHTQDTHPPNNYGYRLIDLCKLLSLYFLNGRAGRNDGLGMCTNNGCSVVDHMIGSSFLLTKIKDFAVSPFDALLSDVHSSLTLSIATDCHTLTQKDHLILQP